MLHQKASGPSLSRLLLALTLALAAPVAFAQTDDNSHKGGASTLSASDSEKADALSSSALGATSAEEDFGILDSSEIPEGLIGAEVFLFPPFPPGPRPPHPYPPHPPHPYPPHPPHPYPPHPPHPYPPYPPQPYPPYPPHPVMYTCFAQDAYGRGFSARGYDPRGTQGAAMNACVRASNYGCRPLGCRAY